MLKENGEELKYCSPKHLAELYLQNGSVEEALKNNPNLPVSIADFHRKVKDFGIIKGIGRRTVSFAEVLYFFASKVADPNSSIEKLYKIMPWAIKESASIATIHRIYQQISEKMVRRYAAALVLTGLNENEILLVEEETQNLSVGKMVGNKSLLMGFGIKEEPFLDSVLRILQREFSTKLTLDKKLTKNSELTHTIIPPDIKPFMYLHLLDVEVAVFHLNLPTQLALNLNEFTSSYRVKNHRFVHTSKIVNDKNDTFRFGVQEIIDGYQEYKLESHTTAPTINSLLNQNMLSLANLK